ncbi:MAG: formate dehydrogenase accessory protein FdhE [Isosphaeraceae bacterium]
MPLSDLFGHFRRRNEPNASGAARPFPPDLARALENLDRLVAERPELAPSGRTLGKVLTAAFSEPVPEPEKPHAEVDLLIQAWRAGVPAFRAGETPPAVDPDGLRRRVLGVVECLCETNPTAPALADALRSGRADPHAWAQEVLGQAQEPTAPGLDRMGLHGALAPAALRLGLLPLLEAHTRRLDGLRPDGIWTRGDCPHCGGPPSLAESRGLEQRRFWRCGVCAAGWPGDRLRCPFCDETDHRRLSYRFVEGEQDRMRLDLCETCGGRLRVVSTLRPISAPGLLVAELATAHLDALGDADVEEPPP